MKSRVLLNAALAVLVAALAVVIALLPEGRQEPILQTLTTLNPKDISRVRLEREDGEAVSIRRIDGTWELTSPLQTAANDFRVMALVGIAEAPVRATFQVNDSELERFGLSPPKARLIMDDNEILFGDTESLHGRRYVMHDHKVQLVDDAYFSHLSARPANYVHPSPLGREAPLRELRVPGLHLFRDANGWRAEPAGALASADDVVALVDYWRHAQATAVRPYDEKLPWHDDVVEARLDDEIVRFRVAPMEFEVILGRQELGIQYHLTKSAGEKLLVM